MQQERLQSHALAVVEISSGLPLVYIIEQMPNPYHHSLVDDILEKSPIVACETLAY